MNDATALSQPNTAPPLPLILGKYVAEAALCAALDLHPRTLRRMDAAGTGPRRRRIGKRKVVYALDDVIAWIENGCVPPVRPLVKRRRRS